MYAFDYRRASSVNEADLALKAMPGAKILAGGQTLLPTMKQRLAQPSGLIDLTGAKDLVGCSVKDGVLTIKAMTTHAAVAESPDVRSVLPGLAALAEGIGDPQVRNRGTIGGSVANNDPAADYPGAVLALGATVHTTKREIAADDFFAGLFSTVLEDNEIITAIAFPVASFFHYAKFPNPASRYAMTGVAVAKTDGGVRVAVTGAGGDGVFRWTAAEQALAFNFSAGALDGLSIDAGAMLSDMHADAAYRANLVKVMAKRAVAG